MPTIWTSICQNILQEEKPIGGHWLFYNMLDVATFAAFILYKENNPQYNTSTNKRRMFLQQLCEQLAMPEIEIQSNNIQIIRHFGPRSGYERRSYKSTSY